MTNTRPIHDYHFEGNYTEHNITTADGKVLNGLLFKADSSKGLILYLHGGGHALDKWARYASTYTQLHYDIFFLDYRGFGKSQGKRPTEQQLYSDVQAAYNNLKAMYGEDHIVVFGYSFGTASAAMLAANNHPKALVLQAPYYSGIAAVQNNYPVIAAIIPSFLLQYQLRTYSFVAKTKAPVVIIHGANDSTFPVSQAYRLRELCKPIDTLIVLQGQGHNGFTENKEYLPILQSVFKRL
ncbi:alpha/beta hydrolase fold protein [Russula earlei]|uniref:Alpha/beta hydrolase fold protein n=1 Tax=Russula earlei TaxID=71964 RepID=A0ACC0TT59_9AGAM|nr:alpha/beta hydrolase fold protein [Russula earlei]